MIRKWTIRIVVYTLITVFLAVMGYYLAASIARDNARMADLKATQPIKAEIVKLDSVSYTDEGSFKWGYLIPDELLPSDYERKGKADGVTFYAYSAPEVEEMGGEVDVCFKFYDGELVTFEARYVNNFVPWVPTQSIVLWIISGITLAVALSYLIRNLIIIRVAKTGDMSVGTFIEAFHPKGLGSRYYKVKYTYLREGETITAISPAIYDGKQVDKLALGLFQVRYRGKTSVIDERL